MAIKGFIEVNTLLPESKRLLAIKDIICVDGFENFTEITLNFIPTKKETFCRRFIARENYKEILVKIEEAIK